jgi:hypothetical protein
MHVAVITDVADITLHCIKYTKLHDSSLLMKLICDPQNGRLAALEPRELLCQSLQQSSAEIVVPVGVQVWFCT